MDRSKRHALREELIKGLSIAQLGSDLEGRLYRDLVTKHLQAAGQNLPAAVAVHESLVLPEEKEGVGEILDDMMGQASDPSFWSIDAGDALSSVSCDLNDALWPTPAEEAGVFNLFQLLTMKLADRARLDPDFYRMILAPTPARSARSDVTGTITKMLGIAVNDCEAGRITKKQLLSIFQDAINNGDILEEENKLAVVAHVIPLIDAGVLQASDHVDEFSRRITHAALESLKGRLPSNKSGCAGVALVMTLTILMTAVLSN